MSHLRYACRRDANEPDIVSALESVGCTVERIDGKPYDLLVGIRGVNWIVEIKTRKGLYRKSQVEFQRTWKGQQATVRTADEALALVQFNLET